LLAEKHELEEFLWRDSTIELIEIATSEPVITATTGLIVLSLFERVSIAQLVVLSTLCSI